MTQDADDATGSPESSMTSQTNGSHAVISNPESRSSLTPRDQENSDEDDEAEMTSKQAGDSFLSAAWEDEVSYEFGTKVQRTPGLARYKQGLKNAIPIRFSKGPKDMLPLEHLGFLNYVTFGWLTPVMWQIYRRGLQTVRALHITKQESAEVSAQRMEKFWKEELLQKGEKEASLGRAIYNSFKTRLMIGAVAHLVYSFLSLATPMLVVRYFLEYLTEEEVKVGTGIVYALLLGIIALLRGVSGAAFWMLNYEAATRIKYGCLALMYRKVVHLKALGDKTVGDIVNFVSNDGQRLWDAIIMGPFILGGPMILVMGLVYSLVYLGPWTLVSFLILIGFYPFAMVLAKKSQNYREESIQITDKRVGLMNELLTYIRLIKMYAWEISFAGKISELRAQEKAVLEKCVFAQSVSMGSSMLVPIFASCITFIAYVATGNNLTATEAFTFVSLVNTLQSTMMTIPFALKALSEMVVSTRRLQEILLMEEMQQHSEKTTSPSSAVEMRNASFTWGTGRAKKETSNGTEAKSKQKKKKNKQKGEDEAGEQALHETQVPGSRDHIFVGPTLRNLTFTLKRGHLLGVCGGVGSGKSSLINAILGRMDTSSGTVAVTGRLAYVSQQAWVTNDSLRDNILFGQEYEADRYKQVVEACALTADFAMFPAGDATEVGERGATLSGGQKQRLSLARSAYSRSDLVLLDDPLSAVDVHIGHHIYQNCIKGVLKGRTLVFVTHNLQYLQDCDMILVMKDGLIVEQGSHDHLMDTHGEYASLIRLSLLSEQQQTSSSNSRPPSEQEVPPYLLSDANSYSKLNHKEGSNGVSTLSTEPHATNQNHVTGDGKLIAEEEMESGALQIPVVLQYIQAMGGYSCCLFVFLCFCLPVAGVTTAGWYLSYWLKQGGGNATRVEGNLTVLSNRVIDHPDLDCYLLIYASFIPTLILAALLRSFFLTKATLRASTNLHNLGFKKILQCTISFFDATPVGRITNRFSADLDEIDVRLPMNLEVFLSNVLQVLASLAMIAYVSPWFLLASVPLAVLFFFLMIVFHVCVRQLKSLDNVTRSPVLSHIGTSVQGLSCIYAYRRTGEFIRKHCELLNTNSVAVFLFYAANRWLALRLDLVSAGVGFVTALLIVVTYDHLNPALAGLALSYSVQMSGLFQFTARLAVETEARFTSVQRILEYCNITDQEPAVDKGVNQPALEWPQSGLIRFEHVNLRYRVGLPLALKDVTFEVESHQKVGIVGRTAAGKSSLAVALYRLVELESGQVVVDGADISSLALVDLRSRLSIIPQDPVLFVGNLRYNLDPFQRYSDADIWQALEKCHIANMVRLLEHQLDTSVVENGDNFSVGERQLICMARAVLRNSKILVLDEATAAIDTETDALIQQTLKEVFTHCTMLVIAHRLNTVIGCDKIVVMEEGRVQEFDSPSNLLSNPTSKFRAMFDADNLVHS